MGSTELEQLLISQLSSRYEGNHQVYYNNLALSVSVTAVMGQSLISDITDNAWNRRIRG